MYILLLCIYSYIRPMTVRWLRVCIMLLPWCAYIYWHLSLDAHNFFYVCVCLCCAYIFIYSYYYKLGFYMAARAQFHFNVLTNYLVVHSFIYIKKEQLVSIVKLYKLTDIRVQQHVCIPYSVLFVELYHTFIFPYRYILYIINVIDSIYRKRSL